jgi:class 3 adenylate cyclase
MADDEAEHADDDGQSGGRRLGLESLAISSKLAATIVVMSVAALLATSYVGLTTGWDLRRDLDEERLTALQASAASNVDSYLRHVRRSTATVAASPQAVVDLEGFSAPFETLLQTPISDLTDEREAVIGAYQTRYLNPIESAGIDVELEDVAPDNVAAVYLQFHYGPDDETPVDADAVDDADDGSDWSEFHAGAHPDYRAIADGLGLLDIYLIEPSTGHIVYSVRKGPDLGTSLLDGPFSGTGLAAAFDQARRNPEADTVAVDLSYYLPTLPDPVAFIAAPVNVDDELVGVVAVAVSDDALLDVLRDTGLTASEEETELDLFLFDADGTLRTDPRGYLVAPDEYLNASMENETLTAEDRALIDVFGSTVLIQKVAPSTVAAVVEDDASVGERPNPAGLPKFSIATPVTGDGLDGLDWSLAVEAPVETVEQSRVDFAERLLVIVAVLMILVAFGAVAWARRLMRPIRNLSDQLGAGLERTIDVPAPRRTPIEFRRLLASFSSMTDRLLDQRRHVEHTRRRRLDLLNTMLPPAIASRIAAGEAPTVDEIPRATVAAVVVLGLETSGLADERGVDRDVVEQILDELDDVADRHQVDRIKVVGDTYFAVCGHDRPFIDHAPRAVSFAIDARDVVDANVHGSATAIGLTVGIDSGPVLAGMTANDGGVYDVWGQTVTAAHYLARLGARGEILISDETRALLPTSITVESAPSHGESVSSVEPLTIGEAR